jgi:hypothetical protein
MSEAQMSAATIVTECPHAKTYCHDNFGYWARKLLIRFGELTERRGPRFALFFCRDISTWMFGGRYSRCGERLSWL